jgi:hypothetical protein
MKNVLIIAGLVFLFYACTPTYAQPIPPTPEQRAACYDRIHAAARDDWPIMTVAERAVVGMRAISLCEGSTP